MAIPFRCVGAIFNDLAGIADDDAVARDIEVDIGVWSNQHIVANRHFTDDNGIGADPNLVPNRRRPFTLAAVFTPDRHAGCNIAVFSDLRIRVNDDRSVVPDKEAFADLSLGGDMKGILLIQNFQPICIVQVQQLIVFCVVIRLTIRHDTFQAVVEQ